jgi:flagellar biosynthesis/type III secretory pathway M-ring protein FliF/YscJ
MIWAIWKLCGFISLIVTTAAATKWFLKNPFSLDEDVDLKNEIFMILLGALILYILGPISLTAIVTTGILKYQERRKSKQEDLEDPETKEPIEPEEPEEPKEQKEQKN